MTIKETAIDTIRQLPDTATWEDIQERIRFLAAIDEGLEAVKAGRVIPHEEVKKSLEKWLSK
jgi:predicted transcriptional regulator